MKIDGVKISENIEKELKEKLKVLGINPKLAIVLIGDDFLSKNYIEQKEKKAKDLKIEVTTIAFPTSVTKEELQSKITELNNDNLIHGIVIQRPLPLQIDDEFATNIVTSKKDVDGFRADSPFKSPIAYAVFEILKNIYKENVVNELKTKQIVIVGKGETGGKPIINFLKEQGINPNIIDSKTKNREEIIKRSDIVISTVGKENIIKVQDLKQNVVLIGVGMYKDKNGKFKADYDQDEVGKITSFYTPVPGGIGPLTIIMLYKNLLEAVKFSFIDKRKFISI